MATPTSGVRNPASDDAEVQHDEAWPVLSWVPSLAKALEQADRGDVVPLHAVPAPRS